MKRNNALALALLPLVAVSLSGCYEDVAEIYPGDAYDTGDFVGNYYTGRHDFASITPVELSSKTLASDQFFAGFHEDDFDSGISSGTLIHKGLASMYPSVLRKDGKTLAWDPDWTPSYEQDDSSYYGTSIGRTLCLGKIDDSFKSGYLSKLYNGQLQCNAWYALSRVQIDQTGYDAYFPKSLASGDYFCLSLRGASDNATNGATRITYADVKVRFYKYDYLGGKTYKYIDVTMPGVPLATDGGGVGEMPTLAGFNFKDILGDVDYSGICGMGVSFSGLIDPAYPDETAVADPTIDSHYALMLYEVMFPGSSWE